MTLTESEIRALLRDAGSKLAEWMHNKDVATNKLVKEMVARMAELAAELP